MSEPENRATAAVLVKRTTKTFNCANCVQKVQPTEFSMSGLMAYDKSKGIRRFFPVAEVIAKVFKVKLKEELSNFSLELCSLCGKNLGEMYKFYQVFVDLGALNSKISDFVRGRCQPNISSVSRSATQVKVTTSTSRGNNKSVPQVKIIEPEILVRKSETSSTSKADFDPTGHPSRGVTLPKVEGVAEIEENVVEVDPFLIFKSSPPNTPTHAAHFSKDTEFEAEESEPMDMIIPDDYDSFQRNSKRYKSTTNSTVSTEISRPKVTVSTGLRLSSPTKTKVAHSKPDANEEPEQRRPARPRPKPTPEQCPFCKKVLTSMPSLRIHIRAIHQQIRPHKCESCELSFKTRGALTVHKEVHRNTEARKLVKVKNHLPEEEKHHKCPICRKGYPTKYALKDHLISGIHNLDLEEARSLAGIVNQRVAVVGHADRDKD